MGNCHPPISDEKEESISNEMTKFPFVDSDNIVTNIDDHFVLGKCLGSGASCSVFIGHKIGDDTQKFAIKQMTKDDEWNEISFKKEADFLTSLQPHPNILKLC